MSLLLLELRTLFLAKLTDKIIFMLENKLQTSLTVLDNVSHSDTAFLTIFFYSSPAQRENHELLIQFFQRHRFAVQNKKLSGVLHNIVKNANFIAQTHYFMSETEFERFSQFLISNVIVVALFYKKRIWNAWRLSNVNKVLSFSHPRFNVLGTNLHRITF